MRSTRARNRIGPSNGHCAAASVTGFDRRSSGGKLSTNFVTRSIDIPRRSASSAGPSAAIQMPMPRSSSTSRAIASSTRSVGEGSPRHDSINWIARCATWPFAVAGFHSNSSGREVVLLAVERRTDPMLGDEQIEPRLEALPEVVERDRISVRMSATRSGSNTTGSPLRRIASSVLRCSGVSTGPVGAFGGIGAPVVAGSSSSLTRSDCTDGVRQEPVTSWR